MSTKLAASACLLIAIGASPLVSAQEAGPESRWSQEGLVELTWDHADDADVTALTVELAGAVRIAGGWTLEASAVLEPVEETLGDASFEGEGAYLDTLALAWSGNGFGARVGKITPVFGSAAALAPGLYGVEIGEGYELAERVGVSGDVNLSPLLLAGMGGDHVLSAAAYTADRSVLSGSVGTERPRLRLEDGGVGNTEGLESLAVSLDGAWEGGLAYTLGWRRLAAAAPGDEDETGWVAGLSHSGLAVGDYGIEVLAEAATFDAVDGVAGESRTDLTLAGTVRREAWHVSAILSGSAFDGLVATPDLQRAELMAGYDFPAGVTLDAGVMQVDDGFATDTVSGLRLSFTWG